MPAAPPAVATVPAARISLPSLANAASSAPIGWPPGRWAMTWYIQQISATNTRNGSHSANSGISRPWAPALSAYWLIL